MAPTAFISSPLPLTRHSLASPLPISQKPPRRARFAAVPMATLYPTPSSPTDSDDSQTTDPELVENQKLYVYESPPTLPGVAFVKGPPSDLPGQMPSRRWTIAAAYAGAKIELNFSRFNPIKIFEAAGTLFQSFFVDNTSVESLSAAAASFTANVNVDNVARVIERTAFRKARTGGQFEERNPTLEPYRDMWNTLDLPEIGNVFMEDKTFCRLRVAGFNPLSLYRAFSTDDMPFSVKDEALPFDGDTIASAIAQNRLYYQDFSFMSGVPQEANTKKIFAVTSALYAIPPGGGDLTPVAIQCNGEVVYPPKPTDPFSTRWAIAKMAVNQNDATHHELVAHLGRTHLLVEPFVIATMRQLSSTHPLHVLLKPHFEGTIFINDTASNNLVAPGGDVDQIFAGDITAVMKWCAGTVINNHFNNSIPDVEMEARGVMDPILEMPYREDALVHFQAMYKWVLAYLSHYYKSDADITADVQLQSWVRELVDPACGRLKGFGEDDNGKVTTVAYLARAVTFVIFSGSVQHAAVNFPQYSLMAYAPAVAGGLWEKPPTSSETANIDRWADTLTPTATAVEQIRILGVIGAVYYTELAQYRRGEMPSDKPIQDALSEYKKELEQIEDKITKRESNSVLKYDYLRPSKIPQSINI
eukprot:GFKZ01015190.1.p1 GENE.GFKZ01015190.1~~GFKZ01015190.1.p1  ORF type:complete len:644 (-),score=90.51 GFKZ01015190.1:154-2085(-)